MINTHRLLQGYTKIDKKAEIGSFAYLQPTINWWKRGFRLKGKMFAVNIVRVTEKVSHFVFPRVQQSAVSERANTYSLQTHVWDEN